MKELVKIMSDFAYRAGVDTSRVFDDFLRYVINGFTLPGFPGLTDWGYTKEQNQTFLVMFGTLVKGVQRQLDTRGWYDAFGTIYEDLIASKSRRSGSGQFFTPETVCDLMTELVYGSENMTGKVVSDCACGSGRTLLSFNARHLGNFYVAEDVDRTCCMMTVCNFLLHGMEGEVVWHDSLCPEKFYGAWRVNEGINKLFAKYYGLPHVKPIGWDDCLLKKMGDKRKSEIRVADKLQANAKRLFSEFKKLKSKGKLTDEERLRVVELLRKYGKINQVIKKRQNV